MPVFGLTNNHTRHINFSQNISNDWGIHIAGDPSTTTLNPRVKPYLQQDDVSLKRKYKEKDILICSQGPTENANGPKWLDSHTKKKEKMKNV